MLSKNIELELLKKLQSSIEAKDYEQADTYLHQLFQQTERELVEGVEEIADKVSKALSSFGEESALLSQAKHDLPDASERLNYVIEETEKASHTTLEAAEAVYDKLDELANKIDDESLKTELSQAKEQMNTIILAQGFQDLTGQVLKRVIILVTELEDNLKSLIEKAGIDMDVIPDIAETKEDREKGIGPNVTAKSKQDAVDGQGDVDDLLADLGI